MERQSAFINGDRCEDSQGNVGFVRECKGIRGPYLKVVVSQGPKTGEWMFPDRFCRRPSIDWDNNGPSTSCSDCERWFNGGVDPVTGLRRLFCVTCEGFHGTQEARRSVDAGPSHGFGSNRPRVYRRTATDDVEDQIAASTRVGE